MSSMLAGSPREGHVASPHWSRECITFAQQLTDASQNKNLGWYPAEKARHVDEVRLQN